MSRILMMIFLFLSSFALFSNPTELKLYRPFGEVDNQAPLIVKKTLQGECWRQSERITREDAWRCIAEGTIYDPCFIKKHNTGIEVRCPLSPWFSDAIEITLSTQLPEQSMPALDMSVNYPWAIELDTGERCLAIGAGLVYDNMEVHYQCNSETIVLGHLQRCKQPWTMVGKTDGQLRTVVITRAWF